MDVYTHTISTAWLRETEPLLNEYFGIGYGYFESDLWNYEQSVLSKTPVGEYPMLKVVEEDHDFPINASFCWDDFLHLFQHIKEDDDADNDIILALFLLAYVIKMKNFDACWEDDTYWAYEIIREDLLKLYIFANERKSNTRQGQEISIKHSTGIVKLENFQNWFANNLLKDYLKLYLEDITSVEQAKNELATQYKKRAGRKIKDKRIHIVLYGIFRMFNEKKKMKSPQSDSLCEFIIAYLQFVGLINEDTDIDNQWIRAQIAYIKTKPEPPKFEPQGLLTRASIEDLKKIRVRLY